MNENIDNDKDYQIMELKQRISYYEPYKQKYEDLKEDWKYIKSLLDKEFNERTRLKKENEQLREKVKELTFNDYKRCLEIINHQRILIQKIEEVSGQTIEELIINLDKGVEME